MNQDFETLLAESPDTTKTLISKLYAHQGVLKIALGQGLEPEAYKKKQALVNACQAAITILEKTNIKSNQSLF